MRRRHLGPEAAAAAAAALLTLAPVGGRAQDRPPLAPTRDVAVTYRAAGPAPGDNAAAAAAAQEIRIAWLAAEGRMRLDLPGRGFMLVDQRARRARMVMEDARAVLEIPVGAAGGGGPGHDLLQPSPAARFAREGADRVAGHACTVWRIEDQGEAALTCVTADGVMLRATTGPRDGAAAREQPTTEAMAVAYGPQDPARFRVPAGYRAMQMPGQMPGQTPGPAPRPAR